MLFCPKCGSILRPKEKTGKKLLWCSCGFTTPLEEAKEEKTVEQKEEKTETQSETRRISEIIRKVLSFSRANRQEKSSDINRIIMDTIDLIKFQLKIKNSFSL